jgi:hypothetical protein
MNIEAQFTGYEGLSKKVKEKGQKGKQKPKNSERQKNWWLLNRQFFDIVGETE